MFLSVIIIALIFYIGRNRYVMGAGSFLATLILVQIWIAAQAFEMAALSLPVKLFWANIQYIPITLTPVTYYCLARQFTHREKLKKRSFMILMIMPIALQVLLWTDTWHGLIRQNVYLNTSGVFPVIDKTFGPLFWLFASYNFALIIFTLLIMGNALREKLPLYKEQIIFLMSALFLPALSTAFHVSGLNPFIVDITPIMFGFSGTIVAWGVFRYRLFDVVPIARSLIIREMNIGMVVLDPGGRLLDINPAARRIFDLEQRKLLGMSIEQALQDKPEVVKMFKDGSNGICEIIRSEDGTEHCYEISFSRLVDSYSKHIGWLLQIYNITDRKTTEKTIWHVALHDALTALPNRNYFKILLDEELSWAKAHGGAVAVAYIDVDDFKKINDNYGHDFGDKVLQKVASRLKKALRETDIVSRIGGDEFVIALPQIGTDNKLTAIGEKMLRVFEPEVEIDGRSIKIGISIGFAVFPRDNSNISDPEELLSKADKAMYVVKQNKKSGYYIYKNGRESEYFV